MQRFDIFKIVNFSWLIMNIDEMIYSGNCIKRHRIKRSPGMYGLKRWIKTFRRDIATVESG